uniref:Peptidase M12B domain-containing protein n=1 Tax=Panagrolaimus sp. JU765 TaxID=591449 RepID=A0AC34QFA0_9BILA
MVAESNEFFYQLDLRVSIVDIFETNRSDLSLYSFQNYHTGQIKELPYHDFAALISYRYAGGLAFVGSMCTPKNILLCGFYPEMPEAMGAIFFHEVAHLLGVPHDERNETLEVENCACNTKTLAEEIISPPHVGCLKIPGFDHDCTVQYLANVIYKNRCLSRQPRTNRENVADGYPDWSQADVADLSICGNGVVEEGEECDCGIPKLCKDENCIAASCNYKNPPMNKFWQSSTTILLFMVSSVLVGCLIGKAMSKSKTNRRTTKSRWTRVVCQPLEVFKRFILRNEQRRETMPRKPSKKGNIETIVSLTPDAMASATGTLKRPHVAPPPPPKTKPGRPSAPPPPPKPVKLTPCNVPLITSVDETINNDPSMNFMDDDDSLSAKFRDFDDDEAEQMI